MNGAPEESSYRDLALDILSDVRPYSRPYSDTERLILAATFAAFDVADAIRESTTPAPAVTPPPDGGPAGGSDAVLTPHDEGPDSECRECNKGLASAKLVAEASVTEPTAFVRTPLLDATFREVCHILGREPDYRDAWSLHGWGIDFETDGPRAHLFDDQGTLWVVTFNPYSDIIGTARFTGNLRPRAAAACVAAAISEQT